METTRSSESARRSVLFGAIAAWRSRRSRQATRRAFESLPDHLLRDIGWRRLPAGPSRYEGVVHNDAEPEREAGCSPIAIADCRGARSNSSMLNAGIRAFAGSGSEGTV